MQEHTELRYAPFFPRLAALALDELLLSLLLFLPRLAALAAQLGGVQALGVPVLFQHRLVDVLFYLVGRAYFVLLTYFGGSTPGKRAMGLRVIAADGGRCGFMDILYRETVGRYLSGVLFIGYLMSIGDAEHRALHDRICDTRVVWIEGAGRGRAAAVRRLEVKDPRREWYKPYRV